MAKPSAPSSSRGDDGIGFLVADITRLMRRRFAEELKAGRVRLTLAEARALVYISRREGLRQVELAALLESQPITVARLVDQLAKAGYVERRADPGDRRAYRLHLRAAAREPLARIARATEAVRQRTLRGLPAREAASLAGSLERIRTNLGGTLA